MDANGNALAVWQKFRGDYVSIWANRYVDGLGWQTALTLEADDVRHAYRPRIAVDADGNGIAIWEQRNGRRHSIMSSRFEIDSGWAAPVDIDSDLPGKPGDKQLSMNAGGEAVVVWEQRKGWLRHVVSNRFDTASGWVGAEYVHVDTEYSFSVGLQPQVGLDDSGDAIVVWQNKESWAYGIWARRMSSGEWSEPAPIEPADRVHSVKPGIAVDGAGNAVVVWTQFDGRYNFNASVWTNRYDSVLGQWGQARPLETDDSRDAWQPDVGIDALGNATVVWRSGRDILGACDSIVVEGPIADAGEDLSVQRYQSGDV